MKRAIQRLENKIKTILNIKYGYEYKFYITFAVNSIKK